MIGNMMTQPWNLSFGLQLETRGDQHYFSHYAIPAQCHAIAAPAGFARTRLVMSNNLWPKVPSFIPIGQDARTGMQRR